MSLNLLKACLLILSLTVCQQAQTKSAIHLPEFSQDLTIAVTKNISTGLFNGHSFAIKKGVPYDEAKDPALRRGTENQEQPQGSFFAIPAVVVGIILLFLFFNRDS